MANKTASAASSGPREFQPVLDPNEFRALLKEGFRGLASCMIWTKGQIHVVNTQLAVNHEQDQVFYAAIPREVDPEWFMGQIEKIGSPDCFFSVSLSRANVFFKSRILGFDDAGFKFEAPKALYKVQRRKTPRLLIPFGRVIRVEMPDPTFEGQKLSKKIFDISAGGLSFVVSDAESAMFPKETVIKDIVFAIGSRRLSVDGEVRHLRPQADDSATPGVKVGILFTRISPGDAQWISAYVFEESRKIVANFM